MAINKNNNKEDEIQLVTEALDKVFNNGKLDKVN